MEVTETMMISFIDLGEVNQGIYSGEIVVSDDTPIVIPSVVLDQTLAFELPDGFSDSFDLKPLQQRQKQQIKISAPHFIRFTLMPMNMQSDVESVEANNR